MKMDDNRPHPGAKAFVQGELVSDEFVAYLRWAIRTGLYRDWKAKGGNLEQFFKAWKRGEV